jgi:tetratricopeptide (TPR) repeat protein
VWNWLRPRIRAKDFSATHIMKSLITAGTVFLVVLLVTPALAEKAQSSYRQGRDLEARQNYEGAYAAYQRAYDASPRETRYRAALTRIRFLAAASKVHRATLLQQAGQLDEALMLLEEAVRIDPSSPHRITASDKYPQHDSASAWESGRESVSAPTCP